MLTRVQFWKKAPVKEAQPTAEKPKTATEAVRETVKNLWQSPEVTLAQLRESVKAQALTMASNARGYAEVPVNRANDVYVRARGYVLQQTEAPVVRVRDTVTHVKASAAGIAERARAYAETPVTRAREAVTTVTQRTRDSVLSAWVAAKAPVHRVRETASNVKASAEQFAQSKATAIWECGPVSRVRATAENVKASAQQYKSTAEQFAQSKATAIWECGPVSRVRATAENVKTTAQYYRKSVETTAASALSTVSRLLPTRTH